jgi:hypothetical protein
MCLKSWLLHSIIGGFCMLSLAANATTNSTEVAPPNTTSVPGMLQVDSGSINFNVDYFRTARQCPSTMYPYIVVIPFKTRYSSCGGGWIQDFRLCVTPTTEGDHYYVTITSGIDLGGSCGTDKSGIGFNWVLNCYPTTMNVPTTPNCNRT